MGTLLMFALPLLLFAGLEWLWRRPSPTSTHAPPGPTRAQQAPDLRPGPRDVELDAEPEQDPFALPFMLRRLDVLAAELARLDRDRTAFARAFRTQVAQAAYDALLADADRLAAAPERPAAPAPSGAPSTPGARSTREITTFAGALREELEL